MVHANPHSFHIPVMGIGFTIDTPLKAAPYGIDSVISLVDDMLMEKLRRHYCKIYELPYVEISKKVDDYRAKRITAYLNLMNKLVKLKFEKLKESGLEGDSEARKYIEMLPNSQKWFKEGELSTESILESLKPGSIDVNIMTKVDKENYKDDEQLPDTYRDAHAALRGFANSKLESSVVFSAGMNPRLYSYISEFSDFFPDENGKLKKKVILKVSDFRSARIQGNFLAKKGIWVSEFRIESGLNCGGHAFATNGALMGPILESFRDNKTELQSDLHKVYTDTLKAQNKAVPANPLPIKLTAQGGIGTAEEHAFLLEEYKLDSAGWGTPFLLVPEVINIDNQSLDLLSKAKEKDLYLSEVSPLGIPFNNIRNNSKDGEKLANIKKGRPGSACPKEYASSNTDFTDRKICTASRQYQDLKIKELDRSDLSPEARSKAFDKIVDKSCICTGLGTSVLLNNKLDTKTEKEGVLVCPGPNMAYFSNIISLREMIDHIYGRNNVMTRNDRPNLFIKELSLYMDYLNKFIQENSPLTDKDQKYIDTFSENLKSGIEYYKQVFSGQKTRFLEKRDEILEQLSAFQNSAELELKAALH
jgi:hypothetical protein